MNPHTKRPIDESVKKSYYWLTKTYVFIAKTKVKTWQSIFVIAFITGIAVALIWSVSTDIHSSSSASEVSQNSDDEYELSYAGPTSPDTPNWVKDAIIYQMRVDQFARSDNDSETTILNEAQKDLGYLEDLGVTTILLNPVASFYNGIPKDQARTSHVYYGVNEPDTLESLLGTKEDFIDFVAAAHDKGIKVLLDVVVLGVSSPSYDSNSFLSVGKWDNKEEDKIGFFDYENSMFYLKNNNNADKEDQRAIRFKPDETNLIKVTGDWNGDGKDTVGQYDPERGIFYLKNSNNEGGVDDFDVTFRFGPKNSLWVPISGDWDGDDMDTVGLYSPEGGKFYLKNKNEAGDGTADITFSYGAKNDGLIPVIGDWNADGKDTVGLYNPNNKNFYLKNLNKPGKADHVFAIVNNNANLLPLSGDWDNDGYDTVGLYDPSVERFYLQENVLGNEIKEIHYYPNTQFLNKQPIAGDWNNNGKDSIGVYEKTSRIFCLNYGNFAGNGASKKFIYNPKPDEISMIGNRLPLMGDWDGDGLDSIGIYNKKEGSFYLSNDNNEENVEIFAYEISSPLRIPISGNWDGGVSDSVGFYDPVIGKFYLNANNSTVNETVFSFGPKNSTQIPIVGDWDGDGIDGVGLYDSVTGAFFLKDEHENGKATYNFSFGVKKSNWIPLTGNWGINGNDSVALYDPVSGMFYFRKEFYNGKADEKYIVKRDDKDLSSYVVNNRDWFEKDEMNGIKRHNKYNHFLWNFDDWSLNKNGFREKWIEIMAGWIKTYDLDGFRCDLEPYETNFQGVWNDIRKAAGKNIVVISEGQMKNDDRGGEYNFTQEDFGVNHPPTRELAKDVGFPDFINGDNNIVDTIKNGTLKGEKTNGEPEIVNWDEKYYTNALSTHDRQVGYGAQGRLVYFGYGFMLSPFIPFWYMGDEFMIQSNSGSRLYSSYFNLSIKDSYKNNNFAKDVKKIIQIRKDHPNIFSPVKDNLSKTNIEKVDLNITLELQPYVMWDNKEAIVVIGKKDESSGDLRITSIPLDAMGLSSANYAVTNLMKDKEDQSRCTNLSTEELYSYSIYVESNNVGVIKVKPGDCS